MAESRRPDRFQNADADEGCLFRSYMKVSGCWVVAVIASLTLLIFSCAPPPPLRQDWRPEQGTAALLELSIAPLEQVEDLTAEASIAVSYEGGEERATALIQLKNPDLFKFEVRGPFFSHVFTALLRGDSLTVHAPGAGGNWTGAADGPLLAYLTGLDLRGYDLRYALLGAVAPGRVDSSRAIEFPRADRAIVPLVAENGQKRRIWVDLHRGFVTRERIELGEGGTLLDRRLLDYRQLGELYLPARVEIRQGETTIVLDYKKHALNRGIPEKRFFQGIPRQQMHRVD